MFGCSCTELPEIIKISNKLGIPCGISTNLNYNFSWEKLHDLCEQLRGLGVFNLLLSDGVHLYSYCSTKLAHITRRAPFGEAELSDAEMTVNFIEHTTPNDIVSVIATEPLTQNEAWQRMVPGELLVWREGEINARYCP